MCCIVLCCVVLYCIVLYCIVLYCIVLYCIVLYCVVLYCIVLYCIVLYRIVLYCIVLYFIVLCCIVLYCILLYCIVFYCIVLYFIVFYCILLYFIVFYCIVFYYSFLFVLILKNNPFISLLDAWTSTHWEDQFQQNWGNSEIWPFCFFFFSFFSFFSKSFSASSSTLSFYFVLIIIFIGSSIKTHWVGQFLQNWDKRIWNTCIIFFLRKKNPNSISFFNKHPNSPVFFFSLILFFNRWLFDNVISGSIPSQLGQTNPFSLLTFFFFFFFLRKNPYILFPFPFLDFFKIWFCFE